jgi:transcription initiation factor TFIIIB Brf1 subunit/transcription initiation factor TFIIB
MREALTFEDFVRLCFDADVLLKTIGARSPRLGGRKPTALKAAAIRYLAKERDLPVTIHQLILVYGVTENAIIPNEKLIRELVQELNLKGEI